jgi:hypothetical protein
VIKIGFKKAVYIVKKGLFLGSSTRLQNVSVSFVLSVIQCIKNSSSESDMEMLKPVTYMD